MKKVLHKILSVFLAFTVMFSTLSFSVDKHVCMGEVTDVSYFLEAENCGMIEDHNQDLDSQVAIKGIPCCDNVQVLFPGKNVEQQALETLKIEKTYFLLAYFITSLDQIDELNLDKKIIIQPPPILYTDLVILHQSFLI